VRKWAALAFSETRKLFIARHSNVANWVGSTWNTCDFGPKEILLPRQKAMNQCEVSLFVSHSTAGINILSWYVRAFSFDRNLKYVVGADCSSDCNPLSEFNLKMFHLPTSDCSNVSSMHFQLFLYPPIALYFSLKQTHNVVESGLVQIFS